MQVHASVTMDDLIAANVLCPINKSIQNTHAFDVPLDILKRLSSGIRLPTKPSKQEVSDFVKQFNRDVMESPEVLAHLADRLGKNLETLGKTLVFVPTIAAANNLAARLARNPQVGPGKVSVVHSRLDEFSESGELIDDDDPTNVDRQIQEFCRRRDACIMVNVGLLTTGFDDPTIRTVVLARQTSSTNLFWQMIGRGLRGPRAGGTVDCYVIDPIRLTEWFGTKGYVPDLEHNDFVDDTFVESGGVKPNVPACMHIAYTPKITIDPALANEVREALQAFLRGDGPLTPAIVRGVSVEPAVDKDGGVSTVFVPSSDETVTGPQTWYRLRVHQLEEYFRPEYPDVNLSWLLTSSFLPPDSSEDSTRLFNHTMTTIKSQKMLTEESWRIFQISMLEKLQASQSIGA